MANDLSTVHNILLAEGMEALREMVVLPTLVNRDFDGAAADHEETVRVPLTSAIPASEITSPEDGVTATDLAPTYADLKLDRWFGSAFQLSDKEWHNIKPGILPKQAGEAVRSLANKIEVDGLNEFLNIYGYHGISKASPAYNDVVDLRTVMNKQLAPRAGRSVVVGPDLEGVLLKLTQFQDVDKTGETQGLREAEMGRRAGFDWFYSDNVQSHAAGTASGMLCAAIEPVGETTIALDTGTGSILAGNIVTFAGDTQTYVVVSATGTAPTTSIVISPGLKVATADGTAVTVVGDHDLSGALQRDAFAFAMRPLVTGPQPGSNTVIRSIADPESGLALRLEYVRKGKVNKWEFDVLYGWTTVRPEYAARLGLTA